MQEFTELGDPIIVGMPLIDGSGGMETEQRHIWLMGLWVPRYVRSAPAPGKASGDTARQGWFSRLSGAGRRGDRRCRDRTADHEVMCTDTADEKETLLSLCRWLLPCRCLSLGLGSSSTFRGSRQEARSGGRP